MNRIRILAIIATSLIFAGCGQATSPSQPGVVSISNSLVVARIAHPVEPDRKASWMSPIRTHDRLIYVSDVGTDDVNVYAFELRNLVGQLTGFNEPQGMCTDSHGNVYVTNTLDSNILEFAHGGTSPIQTFDDAGQYPVDCAVIRFGDLVVANESATNGGSGGLSYFEGTHPSNTITFSRLSKVSSIGYLPAVGFNFITGLNADGNPQYAKFRFALNLLSLPIASPGAVSVFRHLSSSPTLPACTSCKRTTAVNILFIEPMRKRVESALGRFFLGSRARRHERRWVVRPSPPEPLR